MKNRLFTAFGLILTLAPAALAAPALVSLSLQPESRIWVEGTSSVRSYTCRAARVDGTVSTAGGSASLAIADLEKTVRGGEVSVAIAGLECGNATMNGHLRKALRSDAAPRITFRIDSYQVTPAGESEGRVKLNGTLSIAGTERPVSIDATATAQAGRLRVRGSEQIRMSDFGVRPPTLMMGTLKVHDPVRVHFDVVLKP